MSDLYHPSFHLKLPMTEAPNHAMKRTAPAVTLAAAAAPLPPDLPPAVQPARQPPPTLSLGSLGLQKQGSNVTTSQVEPAGSTGQLIEKVAGGRRLIIYAILVQLLAIGLLAFGETTVWVTTVAFVMSLVGSFRLASGLGYSTAAKILIVMLLLLPLVNLITLLVLNSLAIVALRGAGYKVGLLGARR
jgi:hypothetical protein